MAFSSTTLTVSEAQSLQQVLTAELHDASVAGKSAVANIQAALAKLRAHIINSSVPLTFTAAEASTVQIKIAAAPSVTKTSSFSTSTTSKLRN